VRDFTRTAFSVLMLGLVMSPEVALAKAKPADSKAVAAKTSAAQQTGKQAAAQPARARKAAKNAQKPAPPPPIEPSQEAALVSRWVTSTGDNSGLPFMIIDKVAAQVFVFEADGSPRGGAPALLGLARGDGSVPGIGNRKLSAIRPGERTTPAGRFIANYGYAYGGQKVLWVDYANAISIHAVVTNNPKEQRLRRLKSPSTRDNRITFGCINVNAGFYEEVVRKTFTGTKGVVYILPETEPPEAVFPGLGLMQATAPEAPREDPVLRIGTGEAGPSPAPSEGSAADPARVSSETEIGETQFAETPLPESPVGDAADGGEVARLYDEAAGPLSADDAAMDAALRGPVPLEVDRVSGP
jgi:hypothetical protein